MQLTKTNLITQQVIPFIDKTCGAATKPSLPTLLDASRRAQVLGVQIHTSGTSIVFRGKLN